MPKNFKDLSSRQKRRRRQHLLENLSKRVQISSENESLPPASEMSVETGIQAVRPVISPEQPSSVPSTSTFNFPSVPLSALSYSSSSDDEESFGNKENEASLTTDLRAWAIERHISHSALSHLLGILRRHDIHVPTDARTFLQTPREVLTIPMEGGVYCNFGLKAGILKSLQTYFEIPPNAVKVNFNIDGLPLTKSSHSQFWPILGSIVENYYTEVFCIGLFHGHSKPRNVNEFLRYFVDELKDVLNTGIGWQGKIVRVEVNAFICDAPAKAYISCIKTHSGYFSCGKCIQEGDYVHGRVIFPELNNELRTNDSFRGRRHEEHHTGTSILEEIDSLDMVSQFALDYMHVVCLGVVKRILKKVVKGRAIQKIPDVVSASAKLEGFRSFIPIEFSRAPRKLEDIDNWKATELRQFLLYTSILVLKDQFSYEKYSHFLSLSVAIRILASEKHHKTHLDYGEKLINFFVKEFKNCYDLEDVTYNIHSLLHLPKEVLKFGVLDKFSAFKFENYMYNLKKSLEISGKPLQQIHNRIHERMALPVLKKNRNPKVVLTEKNLKKAFDFQHFKLKNVSPDNCVILESGEVGLIEDFFEECNEIKIKIAIFKNFSNFFQHPCDSLIFGIGQVQNGNQHPIKILTVSHIEHKCMKLPINENYSLVVPLIHTYD